jgi:hypothetical protein
MRMSTRSQTPVVLAVLAAVAAVGTATPAAAQFMSRTNPNHLSPRDPITGTRTPDEQLTRPRPPLGMVAYRLPWKRTELDKNGVKYDDELSRLCRRGLFGQRSDGLMRASMRDGWMGLAFADGRNLKDSARVAQPGNAFLIDLQDTSNCTVRVIDAGLIERYRDGGGQANGQPPAEGNRTATAARPAQGR